MPEPDEQAELNSKTNGDRVGRSGNGKASAETNDSARSERGDRDIGIALRRVYQEAASEQVPDDLLDLLNQLN